MPSVKANGQVSMKQHRFMEAVAHNPQFAAKVGVPQKVGQDFAAADDAAGITKKARVQRKVQGVLNGGQ